MIPSPFTPTVLVSLFVGLLSAPLLSAGAAVEEPTRLPGRLFGTFEGIEAEYSPGNENLARSLAERLVEYQREQAELPAQLSSPVQPLSAEDMRLNRDRYLAQIAKAMGLSAVLPTQDECYEVFSNFYSTTGLFQKVMSSVLSGALKTKRISIWGRTELGDRLRGGQEIQGFSYDQETDRIGQTMDFSQNQSAASQAAMQEIAETLNAISEASRAYSSSIRRVGQTINYRAQVGPKVARAMDQRPVENGSDREQASDTQTLLPLTFVIREGERDLNSAEMVDQLFAETIQPFVEGARDLYEQGSVVDVQRVAILLHETVEVGMVDGFIRSKDRRWLCDGVANYLAWRIVRDLHGAELARQVYDVEADVAQYAAIRSKVNLRTWPAAENQSEEERNTELDAAHYAFATRAVFLMHERHGEDILPRLLAELARTDLQRTDMRTVERAWRTVTGTRLATIMNDAVRLPRPAP